MPENLGIRKIILTDTPERKCFYFELKNESNQAIYIKDYILFSAESLAELGLDESDCSVFRSGRHKNDMPSVFRLGQNSEALSDAISGMTETGDKKDADALNRRIVSDHLTILGNRNKYLVISFPGGRKQLFETVVEINEKADFVSLYCKVELGIKLCPGHTISTEIIDLVYTKDVRAAIDRFASEKAEVFGSRRHSKKPAVFCTWYYYGLTVTLNDCLVNLEKIGERKLPFDVFQIDEGWEITLGEWLPNYKFPIDMKELADRIGEAGLRPGIWTSPFVAHETASVWKEHPEWILKNNKGENCLFHMNDTVYLVFDITNPSTRDYFRELYRRLTFDWGYTYHKLDFTRAAIIYPDAVYFDDGITMAEAYYEAVKAIREGMGEDSYFLMCGGLYDPIIGLVDAQRTGSDVLSMWNSNINRDGKTAPYTMKQSMLRYYMNYWWDNDPDALMVRVNPEMERGLRLTYGLLNDDEVRTSVINQYMGGGLVCSTEPLDKITDDRLKNIVRIIPVVDRKCSPLDIMDTGERFPEKMRIDLPCGTALSLVRINWSDTEEMEIALKLDENLIPAGCTAEDTFVVADYYGGCYKTGVRLGDEVKFTAVAPHSATVLKIEKQGDKPIIVRSTGHFSMGREGVEMSAEGNELRFTYENRTGFDISYSVFVPRMNRVVDITAKADSYTDARIPLM